MLLPLRVWVETTGVGGVVFATRAEADDIPAGSVGRTIAIFRWKAGPAGWT